MTKNPPKKKQNLKLWIIIVSVFVILLAYDLSGIGGNIRFYAKWIECGQKPVEPGWTYKDIPHYRESPDLSILRLSPQYFCTPLDAERAGYSASSDSWVYPELDKLGEYPPAKIQTEDWDK